jgi:hypothetical protein
MIPESRPEPHHNDDRHLANKDAIATQIDEGFEQAQRGELIDVVDAVRMLQGRHPERRIA